VTQIHHKPIKKFNLDGIINDEAFTPRLKIEYVRLVVSQMKILGYVPRFDIEPDFTVDYNEAKQYFEFILSIYGIYVGKRQAQWIHGVDGNKVIYTLPNRSKESSTAQV
jgi:hypothetical protein